LTRRKVRLVPLRSLSRLEESLTQLVEKWRGLQEENTSLREENGKLRHKLEELERENRERVERLLELDSQRSQIRSRIEKVVKNISVLEEQEKGSTRQA
jgi:chromosome segregation ATPase